MPRRVKVIKLPENPYSCFDTNLAPKHLIWSLYKEPACNTDDERTYSNGILNLLTRKGKLLESYTKIEKDLKQSDDDDEFHRLYSGESGDGSRLYLYRDNIIRVNRSDNDTYTLDTYYPVSKSSVIDDFARYLIKEKGESRVSVLISRNGNLVASKVTFAPPKIKDLDLNYGTGFKERHAKIVEKLEARNGKLFVMSGTMGSGKSTYLKYLTSIVDREFIFVPVNMVDRLSSPEFITLLMGKKEAVLILEDAEQAVRQRGTGGDDSAVATLLNLSDGILGSLLNITIIVTFNADRSAVDKALLRKGRLAFDHDFGPLKTEDAKRLMTHLGKKDEVKGPLTLAEIYGAGDDKGRVEQVLPSREMGFHTLLGATPKVGVVEEKDKVEQKS